MGTDDENGSFRGVNRSGTLLVLRNIGAVACSVQPFPVLRFVSEHGSCAEAASMALQIGSESLSTPYRTTICGEPRPAYTMTRLRLDPTR